MMYYYNPLNFLFIFNIKIRKIRHPFKMPVMKNLLKIPLVLILSLITAIMLSAQNAGNNHEEYNKMIIRTIHIDSMVMSDPCILPDHISGIYYMTGSGGSMWKSNDLKMWEGPYNVIEVDNGSWMGRGSFIWAPELHYYKGRYYYFATFTNPDIIVDTVPLRYFVQRRGSHILVSDKPEGPFKPMKDNVYTPVDQSTLDGTLWVEDGVPYLVYCHEWMQIIDGTMDAVRLSPDLSETVGKPFVLFRASSAPWVREMNSIGEITFGMKLPGWVTDGPYLFRTKTGKLGMLWSGWGSHRYAQGVAYSASGKLAGPWVQEDEALVQMNSGHGMLFHTFDGKLMMSLHHASLEPGQADIRKPFLLDVDDSGDKIKILDHQIK